MRTCLTCGVDYVGTRKNRSKHCLDCSLSVISWNGPKRYEWACVIPWAACERCGGPFVNKSRLGKYCSLKCQRQQSAYRVWFIDCVACGKLTCVRSRSSVRCAPCQCLKVWRDKKHAKGWTRKASKLLPYIGHRDRWVCQICRRPVIRRTYSHDDIMSPTVDHIIPRADGGSDEPHNLRLAHMLCNSHRMNVGGNEQLLLVG